MSESEKFEQQGKTHAALKRGRSNVATMSSKLSDYRRTLDEINRLIYHFLAKPENFASTAAALKQSMRSLETERMIQLVDELTAESAQVQELQEQVDQF